jgi:hypothetical protein
MTATERSYPPLPSPSPSTDPSPPGQGPAARAIEFTPAVRHDLPRLSLGSTGEVATSDLVKDEEIAGGTIRVVVDVSRKTMRSILGAVAAALAVLSFPAAAFSDATNPFSGTWSTTVDGVAPGSLTLGVISAATGASDYQGLGGQPCAQPTTYYSGNFSNDGTTGTIVGCTLSTDHLVGRFEADNAPAGQSATGAGDITYTAPNSFSGTLDYGGSSYPYTGKLNTGSPPPTSTPPTTPPTIPPTSAPPTSTPPSTPSGSSPTTPTTPSGASPTTPAGSSGSSPNSSSQPGSGPTAGASATPLPGSGLVEVTEPAPGNSATVVSPNPLTATPTATFGVSESAASFAGTTIVGPGELQRQGSGETLACWLIGPGAAQVPPGLYGKSLGLGFFRGRLHAADAYTACVGVAQAVGAAAAAAPGATATATAAAATTQAPARAPAPAVASGCPARRIEVAIQVANGLIVGAQPLPSSVPGPLAVKYTCALGKGGSLEVSLGGPHAGGLRQALGNQLRLGVLRAPGAAARDATLTFSFGATWTGTWKTTHGAMRLAQTGGQLTGTYAACGATATITGHVTGRSFDGTWSERCNGHGGRLHFTLAVDGQSFKGKWGYGGAAPTLSWSATRRVASSSPGPV